MYHERVGRLPCLTMTNSSSASCWAGPGPLALLDYLQPDGGAALQKSESSAAGTEDPNDIGTKDPYAQIGLLMSPFWSTMDFITS